MASQVKLIQNIVSSITKSNLVKIGLVESLNMLLERQNIQEHSCEIAMTRCMSRYEPCF
jgi:hypothetical protein